VQEVSAKVFYHKEKFGIYICTHRRTQLVKRGKREKWHKPGERAAVILINAAFSRFGTYIRQLNLVCRRTENRKIILFSTHSIVLGDLGQISWNWRISAIGARYCARFRVEGRPRSSTTLTLGSNVNKRGRRCGFSQNFCIFKNKEAS
jgi:hypothetical protein